ncbi:hypothetical protein MASR1M45_14060 [Candidatus Kapaibacterium sp.]
MKSHETYHSPDRIINNAKISSENYLKLYKKSISDPEEFWGDIAEKELFWFKKFDSVLEWNYPNYKWFEGGKINICYNCLDRHIKNGKRNKVAYIYTNENSQEIKITYGELFESVSRFAQWIEITWNQKRR